MTTADPPAFAPMSLDFAADCDDAMNDAIATAEQEIRTIATSRAAKRDAEQKIKDREAELSLQAIAFRETDGKKPTVAEYEARLRADLARDPELQNWRAAVRGAQNAIEESELKLDLCMKRWHGAHSGLDYAAAVVKLYAAGGQLQ